MKFRTVYKQRCDNLMASAAKRPRAANSSQIVLVQDEDHASDEEIELDQELEKENEFSG